MAQSTPDKSERWLSIARASRRNPPDTISFSGHTRAYHARVHREGSGREAAGRRGSRDYVYIGKEGGWLEPKGGGEAHSRTGSRAGREDEDAREGENGRLICRALSYLRYAFYSSSCTRRARRAPPCRSSPRRNHPMPRCAEKGRG